MPGEAVRNLAPCGLNCGTCLAFDGGPVQGHAKGLKERLGANFAVYADRFEAMNPVFEKYGEFRALLDFLAKGSCTGCRGRGCLFADCKVGLCASEHEVDFCFECSEFPCDRHGLPDRLAGIWRMNNERMAETGPEAYYERVKDKPRYP